MNNNKNNYISIAKGIGIILMVIGHCGAPGLIGKFIYLFHMPLFFICSGYFLKIAKDRESLLNIYKNKIIGIYIKFLFWSIIFLSLHNVFYHLNIYNSIITFNEQPSYLYNLSDIMQKAVKIVFSMNEHEQLVRSFWFLKQLLITSIFVPSILYFTNHLTKHKYVHELVLCLLFIITLISKYYNWSLPAIWDISLVFMSSTFYLSGYIFRKYDVFDRLNKNTYSIIFFALLLAGTYILPWINMLEYTYISAIPYIIVAFSGTLLTFNVSKRIESYKVKNIFYYLGQNTMIILALHMLCFKIGNLLKIITYGMPIYRLAEFQIIYEHNQFFWIIYTIIGLSLPLLLDYCMKKINGIKTIWRHVV